MDESMMGWFNKYSPGFMCVGRNPHLFGNERHILFFGLVSIAHFQLNEYMSHNCFYDILGDFRYTNE